MAKLNLTYNEFQELQLNLKLINRELNWINSFNDGDNNSWFRQDKKEQLEARREAIWTRIDKSIKKTEPQQSPQITLPDSLSDKSKSEVAFYLHKTYIKLANEKNEKYKDYYQAFVEKENGLLGQERAEFEKLLYNDWVNDFCRK
jgi:hypothetical protein